VYEPGEPNSAVAMKMSSFEEQIVPGSSIALTRRNDALYLARHAQNRFVCVDPSMAAVSCRSLNEASSRLASSDRGYRLSVRAVYRSPLGRTRRRPR